jgi:geranylgeranyl pyrophosphate synthase
MENAHTATAEHDVHPGSSQREAEADRASFLVLVENRLDRALSRGLPPLPHPTVGGAARRLVFAPGAKRARPMLVETLSRLTRIERWAALDFAAAVELIHTASLLHDDVIDGADTRRGQATANARHGNAVAVLAGDYVLTAALRLLRPWGGRAVDKAVEVIAEMTAGVATEVLARRCPDLGLDAWREMAEQKTGTLFGLAAWLVAWPGDRAERFDRALRHLGVAFQIADDAAEIAAVLADPTAPSQDLSTANPSFPVVFALDHAGGQREALAAFWRDPSDEPRHVAAAARRVVELGGLSAARAAIQREVALGRTAFGRDVEQEAVQVVLRWADTLVAF